MARLLLFSFIIFPLFYSSFANAYWTTYTRYLNNTGSQEGCTSAAQNFATSTNAILVDARFQSDSRCWVKTAVWYGGSCPEGQEVVYPSESCSVPTPTCTEDQFLDETTNTCIDHHSCPSAGTFYKRMYANSSSIAGFSTCLSMNCVVTLQKEEFHLCINNPDGTESCPYDVFYTGQTCAFNPDDEGMKPPEHEWPEDPVEPPLPDTPDVTDLPDYEDADPVYDPDDDGLPDDPATPPNPDPQPDPDNPDLSTGENAIVGELSEANQRLENIDHVLQDLTNTTKADNDRALAYAAQFLGQMTEINRELDEGGLGSGGGGGSGTGTGEGDGTCEEDCVPVNFPGAPEVVDPFAEILDETDINDIITRTEDTKTQLEAKMNNFKGLFSVPNYGAGGTITPIEFDLQHRDTTIPVKFGIFDIIAPDIASIITLIAAVICFLIVTTRR